MKGCRAIYHRLKYFIWFLLAVTAIGLLADSAFRAYLGYSLPTSGVHTIATVTGKETHTGKKMGLEPQTVLRFRYSAWEDGVSEVFNLEEPVPQDVYDNTEPGARMEVTYHPDFPSYGELLDGRMKRAALNSLLYGLLIVSLTAGMILHDLRRRRRLD